MKKKKKRVKDDSLTPEELEVFARRKLDAVKRKAKAHRKRYEENPPAEVAVVEHTNVPTVKEAKSYTLIQRNDKGTKLKKPDGTIVKVSTKRYLKLKKKGLIVVPPPPKPERKLPKSVRRAQTPRGFHAILCGDDRVTIVDLMNNDAKDVKAYHHRMGTTLHLLTQDLRPKDNVVEAIRYLRTIKDKLKE